MSNTKGIIALSPLIVFVLLYLVTSIIIGDFYKVPITVAFMASGIYGIAISKGIPFANRIDIFSEGASTSNMMMMIWIFVLAGAFANSAKTTGCIDATINLTLSALPPGMVMPGLFLAACFISLSIGTSVGTIVALTPIAAGMTEYVDQSPQFITAIVVGGAFFGDNLSFISDTTVVATRTQGCKMSDKFRVNSYIVMPAAFVVLIIYTFIGLGLSAPSHVPTADLFKVIPYIVVLVAAIAGMNVMAVLTTGLILTGITGIACGCYDIYGWLGSMGEGIVNMGELIIITMLAGGLLAIVKANGGIDYIIEKIGTHINGKRGAELSIATLVSIVNLCTANNTVAILTTGGLAKKIGDKYGLDNRKCASILDTFSCCIQGIIPYGAQLLMAAGLAKVNPVSIVPYIYYSFIVGGFAILSILIRYPRHYS